MSKYDDVVIGVFLASLMLFFSTASAKLDMPATVAGN